MKRGVQCAAVCAAVLMLVSLSLGKDKAPKPGPMTGTWECVAHGGPNGDMQFTLELEQAKDTLTGSVSSPIGSTDISSGTVKKNTFEIRIESPQGNYLLSGKLHKDAISGDWKQDTEALKGTWEGKKSTSSASK